MFAEVATEDVRELNGVGYSPLLREEGWTRHPENGAKHPLKERTGWSIYQNVSECGFASSLTTPSARNKDASRDFHDRASTPPPLRLSAVSWNCCAMFNELVSMV